MYIRVKVKAGARRDEIKLIGSDRLEISVKEKARQGLANSQVLSLVAEWYGCLVAEVHLVRGKTTPNKIFEIKSDLVKIG